MSFWDELFKNTGNALKTYGPSLQSLYQSSRPMLGAGMYGAGLNQIFDAQARSHQALLSKQAEEMRNQSIYNQQRHDQFKQRQALMGEEDQRQTAMRAQRQRAFDDSLSRMQKTPEDIESTYQAILDRYADTKPSAGDIAAPASERAPAVVKESLGRERAKRGKSRAQQSSAKARMLAPQMAMASGALGDADATSALRSLAGRAQDSARVGAKEQSMFAPPALYPSGQLGFDPSADIDKALGGLLMNYGGNMMAQQPAIDWGQIFGGMSGSPSSPAAGTGNAYQYRPGPVRRRYL